MFLPKLFFKTCDHLQSEKSIKLLLLARSLFKRQMICARKTIGYDIRNAVPYCESVLILYQGASVFTTRPKSYVKFDLLRILSIRRSIMQINAYYVRL
jgi:ABC-type cobalamin/Fe3+-siderophores transport system ATPase subunit